MPGLVNAHTHLELSYLRDEVAPASEFVSWIRALLAARRQPDAQIARDPRRHRRGHRRGDRVRDGRRRRHQQHARQFRRRWRGARSPASCSTRSSSSTLRIPRPSSSGRGVRSTRSDRPAMVRTSLAAHAPYSVAPLVFRAIRKTSIATPFAPCSVHLAESAEEVEFIRTGGGPWRTLLEELGSWDPSWTAPGVSPVQYLDDNGFLDARVLAVHGVQMSPDDLARLASRGTTLVTCPRSNGHTGAGVPPIEDFYESGVRVAIGTDSLASAPDLNVFAEVATLHALAPVGAGRGAARERDAAGRPRARLRRRLRHDRAGQACAAARGRRAAGYRRCGRISGVGSSARADSLGRMMFTRLRTYLSFVRFSHSVFALPFALAGALLAARHVADHWRHGRLDSRGDGVGAQRGDGIQSARRRAHGRAQPANGESRAAARRDVDARGGAVCRGRVDLFRLRGVAAEPAVSRCCRRSRWRSCSGIRSRSGTRPGRRCSSAWRWPWRRSADGSPWAAAAAGSRGFSRWPSGRGSADSTCCMPARTSSSIARTACGRFRCASACAARSRSRG